MADIIYTYKNHVYGNITNQCNCACTFCIRSHQNGIGDAFPALLDFTEKCQKAGIKTQLSVVDVLPEEDIRQCQEIAKARDVNLRVRVFGQ